MAQHSKALKVSLISTLLIIGLAATPARAHHNNDLLVPLAGFLVLGSLLSHDHGQGHGYSKRLHGQGYGYSKRHHGQGYEYSKRRYSSNGYYGSNGHSGQQYKRRARSYSQEGYKRRPKPNKHR